MFAVLVPLIGVAIAVLEQEWTVLALIAALYGVTLALLSLRER